MFVIISLLIDCCRSVGSQQYWLQSLDSGKVGLNDATYLRSLIANCWEAISVECGVAHVVSVCQVEFDADTVVTGITTQGHGGAAQWVTSFRIRYSADGNTFTGIKSAGSNTVKLLQDHLACAC